MQLESTCLSSLLNLHSSLKIKELFPNGINISKSSNSPYPTPPLAFFSEFVWGFFGSFFVCFFFVVGERGCFGFLLEKHTQETGLNHCPYSSSPFVLPVAPR